MQAGASFAGLLQKGANALTKVTDVNKQAEAKQKADSFIQQYNSNSGVFADMPSKSMATLKLSRLLLPIDQELSQRYAVQAQNIEKQENETLQNKGVADAYQAGGYKGAGAELLKSNPERGIELLGRQDALDQKNEEKQVNKMAQDAVLQEYNIAVDNWSKAKDDNDQRNNVTNVLAKARSLGLTLPDVISKHISEKTADSNLGLREQTLEQQNQQFEKKFKADEENAKAKRALDWAQFAEAKKKADAEAQAKQSGTVAGTEGENKAVGFASRMIKANDIMKEIAPKLTRLELIAIASNTPLSQLSTNASRYKYALEDYVRAVLRQESGAVIGDSEMQGGFSQYGIHPFDSDEVKADKFKRVELGIKSMQATAGKKVGDIEKITGGQNQEPKILFKSVANRKWQSTDGGKTWQAVQ